MCDYSLHNVVSRPAKIGDELITTKFAESTTSGFSAVGEPNVAVCLLPGTEIVFEKEAEYRHPLAWLFSRSGKLGAKMARFRQINPNVLLTHHDALEFANGKTMLLTQLRDGQRARVIQLPAQPQTPDETAGQRRLAVVT
jgi:hypothetical protein